MWIRIRIDPHHFGNLDLDPHQSDKLDPDRIVSDRIEFLSEILLPFTVYPPDNRFALIWKDLIRGGGEVILLSQFQHTSLPSSAPVSTCIRRYRYAI